MGRIRYIRIITIGRYREKSNLRSRSLKGGKRRKTGRGGRGIFYSGMQKHNLHRQFNRVRLMYERYMDGQPKGEKVRLKKELEEELGREFDSADSLSFYIELWMSILKIHLRAKAKKEKPGYPSSYGWSDVMKIHIEAGKFSFLDTRRLSEMPYITGGVSDTYKDKGENYLVGTGKGGKDAIQKTS